MLHSFYHLSINLQHNFKYLRQKYERDVSLSLINLFGIEVFEVTEKLKNYREFGGVDDNSLPMVLNRKKKILQKTNYYHIIFVNVT